MKLFYDFHIHSSLSPCSDNDMTPNNIINMAILKGLDAIAITDHNSFRNVEVARTIAEKTNIVFIPGAEIQTIEDVHMVCLFKTIELALKFEKIINEKRVVIKNNIEKFGNQIILDKNDIKIKEYENLLLTSINITVDELLLLVKKLDGVVIPAHIDREINSIISTLGFIPDEYDFKYVEVSQRESSKKILENKSYKERYNILRNSDAHNLWSINEPLYYIEVKEKNIDSIIEKLKGSY